jgi:hypothetical protein
MGLERSPEVTYEVVDGRAILIDAKGTELITLNPVGTMVWDALDGTRDAGAVADHLLPSLEGVTKEQLESDVAKFLGEMRDEGLVVEADAGR